MTRGNGNPELSGKPAVRRTALLPFPVILSAVLAIPGCTSLPENPGAAALTGRQLWAIALSGMMTELNNDRHTTLNFNTMNGRNKRVYRRILRRDWNVHNKNELLQAMEDLERSGSAAGLERLKRIITENHNDIERILEKHTFSKREYNRLEFILKYWEIYRHARIAAWDLGRAIALCRWGFDVGFLSEEEALERIMYYAKKIQPLYGSWEEYGLHYSQGRIYWASGFGSKDDEYEYMEQTDRLYKKLTGDSGYWRNLEWNVELGD